MSTHLCITVRWIVDRFHGFVDGTELIEWPPSPFRLFQAFVASAHRHGMTESRRQALEWLERQQNAPELLAVADPATGVIFDHWVPDNDNLVTHRKGSIRRFKPVLHGDRPLVHYVWPINPADHPPIDSLDDLAATLGWFGWAVDAACASVTLASVELFDSEKLPDYPLCRFQPVAKTARTDGSVRVAKPGSAAELERLYTDNCISFSDQPQRRKKQWPKVFDRVIYTTPDRSPPRPRAIFKLVDANEDAFRYPHAKLIHIAGMVRHLAIQRMQFDPPPWIKEPAEWVNRVVRGKRDTSSPDGHRQFSYVPLSSIGHEHADAMIRNVMIVAPLGMDRELAHLAEALSGEMLQPEGEFEACERDAKPIELRKFTPPRGKFIDTFYLGTSNVWQTVTPAILDGHTKKSRTDRPEEIAHRTQKLICKALRRAGIESPCEFTWQSSPYLTNCLSAHKFDRNGRRIGYYRPTHLEGLTAVHVRLTFTHPVPGPITLGAGRHCGFGLMAPPIGDDGK